MNFDFEKLYKKHYGELDKFENEHSEALKLLKASMRAAFQGALLEAAFFCRDYNNLLSPEEISQKIMAAVQQNQVKHEMNIA